MDNDRDNEKWEVVMSTSGMTSAHIIAGRLEAEGIPVQFKYDVAGAIYAVTIDGLGEVKILVPSACRQWAQEILSRSYDETDMEWGDNKDNK